MINHNQIELWGHNLILFRVINKKKRIAHYKARPKGAKIIDKQRIAKKEYYNLWRQYAMQEVFI